MIKVAPSILSANILNLATEISVIEDAGADMLHIDIMDGHFVPNLTFGPAIVSALKNITKLTLDVHLMVNNPDNFIEMFALAGADIITFHYEASKNVIKTIDKVKKYGIKAGLSLMPETSVANVISYLYNLDLFLLMTVKPGFAGQSFISSQLEKISYSRQFLHDNCILQVDGGINPITAKQVIAAGANCLVSGSYIFGSTDYKQAISSIRF
jgi:ribulose-phosphate 3-epimerase